jgi:hypothetical protein
MLRKAVSPSVIKSPLQPTSQSIGFSNPKSIFIVVILIFLYTFVAHVKESQSAPTLTSSGSVTTYKFAATIDSVNRQNCKSNRGSSDCTRYDQAVNIDDPTLEIWYQPGSGFFGQSYTSFANIYFEDLKLSMPKITANQIVSSRIILTAERAAPASGLQATGITSQWEESNPIGLSTDGLVGYSDATIGLQAGSTVSTDTTSIIKGHFSGTSNYGLKLGFVSAFRETRSLFFHSSESTQINYRPYLEIVVDTSLPSFPAPTDSPGGLAITGGVNSATVTWTTIPTNTEKVLAAFNCSTSGVSSVTVDAKQKSATKAGLVGGETCSSTLTGSNGAGSSPTSMRSNVVTVIGTPPTSSPSATMVISGTQGILTIAKVTADTTQIRTTLSCASGLKQEQTTTPDQTKIVFNNVKGDDSCNAILQAVNQWGVTSSDTEVKNKTSSQTIKFLSTMDSGRQRGNSWGSTDPVATANSVSAQEIKLSFAKSRFGGHSDAAYIYFGDYETQLKKATPNQIVSAYLVLTWKTGTSCKASNISLTNVSQSWTERSIVDAAPTVSQDGNFQQVDFEFIPTTASGNSKTYINVTDFIRRQITGTPNYGFSLSRFGPDCSDDGASFYTRESIDVNSRPYVAITIDLSRPTFPAPTEAPTGLGLTPTVGSVTATWNTTPTNAEKIKVDFACSVSGTQSTTVASTQKTASVTGLIAGEKCSATVLASNTGGESPVSMRTPDVTVIGVAPNATAISNLKTEPGQAVVEISRIADNATEYIVTLNCSESGKKSETVPVTTTSVNFRNLRAGETCSASTQSRNEWGISGQGVSSATLLVPGTAPSAINFTSDINNPGSIRLTWSSIPAGATAIESLLRCLKAGDIAKTLTTSDRSTSFSGLASNDVCEVTMWASNRWGASAKTTFSGITVKGSAPPKPNTPSIAIEEPLEFVVNFSAPLGSDFIDLHISCEETGDRTFSDISPSKSKQIITGAKAGDSCYAAIVAKNEWGSSAKSSFAGPVKVLGVSPSQPPSGLSVFAGTAEFRITWTDGPEESVEVNAFCSVSGNRKAIASLNARRYVFIAFPGESCSATLASRNPYGVSRSTPRSKSVVIQKAQNSSNSATPKKTATPKASPAPKASSTGEPNTKGSNLICVKGSQVRTITGANPTCPAGWVKKPTISKQ